MSCNVYLLKCDFGDEVLYKIGFTKRPVTTRVKELKTGNANYIKIIHIFTSDLAIKIESTLHRLYNSKRINGEWFDLNNKDVELFMENCQTHHDNFELISTTNTYYIEHNR
jgi:hypothetical protein